MKRAAICVLVFAVVAAATTPVLAGKEQQSIAAIAGGNPDFSTLVLALQTAGLVETLDGKEQYTVFAPTNAAFEKALGDLGITAEELLADTALLKSILLYHVTRGSHKAKNVLAMKKIKMLDGNFTMPEKKEEGAFIGGAKITDVDIMASNGVIHVIDYVLLPPKEDMEKEE